MRLEELEQVKPSWAWERMSVCTRKEAEEVGD